MLASASEEWQIVSLMEKIRKSVEDMRLQHPDGADKVVTISLGGVLVRDCCDMSFDEAFRRADEALYSAKAQGRNRSVLSGSCSSAGDAGCLVRPHS